MALQSIDHVQVAAPPGSEPAARVFYGEVLGLQEIPKPASLATRGGVWFELGASQALHVGIDDEFRPARKAHPALACTSIDDLADRLEAAGAPLTWDRAVPGVRRFFTADPFGNRIEVVSISLSSAF